MVAADPRPKGPFSRMEALRCKQPSPIRAIAGTRLLRRKGSRRHGRVPSERVPLDHEASMRLAIAEAELARGGTGDNPWVGCVIADAGGVVLGRGHTQGPGEDHAEIGALREAEARGVSVRGRDDVLDAGAVLVPRADTGVLAGHRRSRDRHAGLCHARPEPARRRRRGADPPRRRRRGGGAGVRARGASAARELGARRFIRTSRARRARALAATLDFHQVVARLAETYGVDAGAVGAWLPKPLR